MTTPSAQDRLGRLCAYSGKRVDLADQRVAEEGQRRG